MKCFPLTLLCVMCISSSYAQTAIKSHGLVDTSRTNMIYVKITKEKKPKKIFTKVEIKSAQPEGDSSWAQTLERELNNSIRVHRRVKKGTHLVAVQFIAMKDSTIADTKCVVDPGSGMCEEVLRAVRKHPKWGFRPGPVRPYRRSSVIYPG